MRSTFRPRRRKIMCFSVLHTGKLIWLPERGRLLPFPELRGWLCSAKGEDGQRGRAEDRGRWEDSQRRVTVQRGNRHVSQRLSADAPGFCKLAP